MIYVSDIDLRNAVQLTLHIDRYGLKYVGIQHTDLDGITRCRAYYYDLGLGRWMGDWRKPVNETLNDLFNVLFATYDAGSTAVEEVFNCGKN